MSSSGDYKCGICEQKIDSSPVICSKCQQHFHGSCVRQNENVITWSCPNCPSLLNPPPAPKSKRQKSIISHLSDGDVKSTSSSKARAESQLRLLEEQERLRQQQSKEKDAVREAKIRQLQEQEDEMKKRHEQQQEFLRQKSVLLETLSNCSQGSDKSSERSSVKGRRRVEDWSTTFAPNIGSNANKESTTIHPKDNLPDKMQSLCVTFNTKPPYPSTMKTAEDMGGAHQKTAAFPFVSVDVENQETQFSRAARPGAMLKENADAKQCTNVYSNHPPMMANGNNSSRFWNNSSFIGMKEVYELPRFDGTAEQWPVFISKFENTATAFPSDVNLVRLQHSLKGDARVAVEDLLTMPNNIIVIIDTLRNVFGRPEYIINSLREKIRKEPKPKVEDFDSIIAFSLQIRNICSTMQASQLSEHLADPTLLQELIGKLPTQYLSDWADFKSEIPVANLEVFSEWMYRKAMRLTSILTKAPQLCKKNSKAVNVHQESSSKPFCKVCGDSCKSVSDCDKFNSLDYSERWKTIKTHDICRCCLRCHKGKCKFSKQCGKNGCVFKHNPLLHNDSNLSASRDNTITSAAVNDNAPRAEMNSHHSLKSVTTSVLFKIVPVTLLGGNKTIDAFAMMDDGSSVTLIEENLFKELNVDAISDPLCLKWTSDEIRDEHNSMRFDLQIRSKDGSKYQQLHNVRTVRQLHLPSQTLDAKELKSQYSYLKQVPILSYSNARPTILIGLNNSMLMLNSKSKSGGIGDPIAIKTKLGWAVYGIGNEQIPRVLHICECGSSAEKELLTIAKEFITLENLDVSPSTKIPISSDEQRAVDIMNTSTRFNGSRFECGLLWKFDNIEVPNSYNMALCRLKCLERKLKRDPDLKQILDEQIQSYLDKGYIRLVEDSETLIESQRCWYLPIFTVSNPNKPNKIRVVWDAAATVNGISLNSLLLKGPDLLASLPGVLMRFRERRWAVTGDICEMFHQVKVKECDQQYQRFLWRTSPTDEPKIFIMTVVTFGATCSPALAQYVKNKNAARFKESHPQAYRAIVHNHYVDDWLESIDSEDMALQLANEVKEIHAAGGFQMRKWISNSKKVMEALGSVGDSSKNLNISSEMLTEKVLGMWWSVSHDNFTYSLRFNKGDKDVLNGDRVPTKRQILRIVMSVYDPLGMLAHFMAYPKILLQLIWRKGTSWDEEIPEDLNVYWLEWVKLLPQIEMIRIPRFYFADIYENIDLSKIELHIFVDGSEEAYAAAGYLRYVCGDTVFCKLIAAKSRVAPIKHHSVPRLELLAAVLGVRLATTIEKQHSVKFNKRQFWSDSKTVCGWIKSKHRRYKQYVACRVGEILESTDESEWQWLSTFKNIADAATRMKLMDLNSDSEWFCGPKFLFDISIDSNKAPEGFFNTNEEIRSSELHHVNLHHVVLFADRFSNWTKLLRATAYAFRYIQNLKAKRLKTSKNTGPLQQSELQAAETIILRQAQMERYSDEIAELRTSTPPRLNKKSKLYKLLPFLDDHGVLRRRGRLDEAQHITGDVKHPIILPDNHKVTDLLLRWYHRRYHHHNNETVTNEVRQKYHYPKVRKDLRRLRTQFCQKCKNELAKPKPPIMSTLPLCRLQTFTSAFTYVGVDYFGPISVCVGRRNEKRWGLLVTCLTFRAIHLESVNSLTTSSCILALRSFICSRGPPREIYSDNATTFKGASNELKQHVLALDTDALATEFNSTTLVWKFIPPTAAHMGGAWERLIRIVKKNLYHITSLRNIQEEIFRSLLKEVESVVNSRPLTYVPIDNYESEALTPNHFLIRSSSGNKHPGSYDTSGRRLRNSWLVSQQLTEIYYKRFVKEIIPELNRRQKWHENVKEMVVGDVVLVLDGNIPKYYFVKGRVLQVYPGRDGRVRSASVKTDKGIYDRPVTKLAILDVEHVDSKIVNPEDPTNFTEGSVTATQLPITN